MQANDVLEEKRLMQIELKTTDGDSELDPEIVFKQSEKNDDEEEDDEEEFEEDGESTPLDSSSGVGQDKASNCIQTEISGRSN